MNTKITNILVSLKAMKPRDFVYPGILLVFIIGVVIIFFTTTQFISSSLNKVFSVEQSGETSALNMERYNRVLKKLKIPATSTETAAVSAPNLIQATTTTKEAPALDKQAITINILNSTPKTGAATELAKVLISAGFSAPKTGNQKKLSAVTAILIKESQYAYAPLLLEAVSRTYAGAVATTTPDTSDFDATIIIGTK